MKTAELEGAALDYYVALAHGMVKIKKPIAKGMPLTEFWGYPESASHPGARVKVDAFKPSSDHGWGGPIIERERIELLTLPTMAASGGDAWMARSAPVRRGSKMRRIRATGPTILIAAMRAFVASKFGDEVEEVEDIKEPS